MQIIIIYYNVIRYNGTLLIPHSPPAKLERLPHLMGMKTTRRDQCELINFCRQPTFELSPWLSKNLVNSQLTAKGLTVVATQQSSLAFHGISIEQKHNSRRWNDSFCLFDGHIQSLSFQLWCPHCYCDVDKDLYWLLVIIVCRITSHLVYAFLECPYSAYPKLISQFELRHTTSRAAVPDTLVTVDTVMVNKATATKHPEGEEENQSAGGDNNNKQNKTKNNTSKVNWHFTYASFHTTKTYLRSIKH